MTRLEVLCVAMHQTDFSLAEKMNLRCDAVIANQTDATGYRVREYPWGTVKLVSSETRGVGKNRNTALLHATGEILLLSDDDMQYTDTYVEDILSEFDSHPDADVMIFNILSSDPVRKQVHNPKTRRLGRFSRLPYGAPRVAIRRSAWEKSNVWFTVLFGGGAKYTSGEDSLFLADLKRKKLRFYVSRKQIGTVDMSDSSWFQGRNEEYFFNKGAYCAAVYPASAFLWMFYYSWRLKTPLRISTRLHWMLHGMDAYRKGISYKELK